LAIHWKLGYRNMTLFALPICGQALTARLQITSILMKDMSEHI